MSGHAFSISSSMTARQFPVDVGSLQGSTLNATVKPARRGSSDDQGSRRSQSRLARLRPDHPLERRDFYGIDDRCGSAIAASPSAATDVSLRKSAWKRRFL